MATRPTVIVFTCAVATLMIAAPLATGDVTITRGSHGPIASAVTWQYLPSDYGIWSGTITNRGLKSLVVEVYDNTTGVPQRILCQKFKFATCDAFPTGYADTDEVFMYAGHSYSITATPNGRRGTSCDIQDRYRVWIQPVAYFTASPSGHSGVTVDASDSSHPDAIVSYDWSFGDGRTASGIIVSHAFATEGSFEITLTVTDILGMTDSYSRYVTVKKPNWPPTATFEYSRTGTTVSFDASRSYDDYGIVSYTWDWGDGTTAETMVTPYASHTYPSPPSQVSYVVTLTLTDGAGQTGELSKPVSIVSRPQASFTYSTEGGTISVDASGSISEAGTLSYTWDWGDGTYGTGMIASHTYQLTSVDVPSSGVTKTSSEGGRHIGMPFLVFGQTFDSGGLLLFNCDVNVTNMRTGEYFLTTSDAVYAYYEVNIYDPHQMPSGIMEGDVIRARATNPGLELQGWNQSALSMETGYIYMNLILHPYGVTQYAVTLTIVDRLGQTDQTVEMIVFPEPPTAYPNTR